MGSVNDDIGQKKRKIGELLRSLRSTGERHLTQMQLAKRLSVTPRTVRNWEQGKLTRNTFILIVNVLKREHPLDATESKSVSTAYKELSNPAPKTRASKKKKQTSSAPKQVEETAIPATTGTTSNEISATSSSLENVNQATGNFLFLEDYVYLRYDQDLDVYHLKFQKKIQNIGQIPITRVYCRIAVDKFPGEPERSREHYRKFPLEMDKINFRAFDRNEEELNYEVEFDYDSNKEIYILLRSGNVYKSLYPGETTDIYYTFTVSTLYWGPFLERNIRVETKKARVVLVFPERLNIRVWGIEKSLAIGELPISPAIMQSRSIDEGEEALMKYEWTTTAPSLYSRYRFMWQFAH